MTSSLPKSSRANRTPCAVSSAVACLVCAGRSTRAVSTFSRTTRLQAIRSAPVMDAEVGRPLSGPVRVVELVPEVQAEVSQRR
jgi:hypothetical protein